MSEEEEVELAQEFVAALRSRFGMDETREPVSTVQFEARCNCAHCWDTRRDTTTLVVMHYEQMLPTLPARLKLGRVTRAGTDRGRSWSGAAERLLDLFRGGAGLVDGGRAHGPTINDPFWPIIRPDGTRTWIEPIDLPKSPQACLSLKCRRCGWARAFRLATVFSQARTAALAVSSPTTPPSSVDEWVENLADVPAVEVWF